MHFEMEMWNGCDANVNLSFSHALWNYYFSQQQVWIVLARELFHTLVIPTHVLGHCCSELECSVLYISF